MTYASAKIFRRMGGRETNLQSRTIRRASRRTDRGRGGQADSRSCPGTSLGEYLRDTDELYPGSGWDAYSSSFWENNTRAWAPPVFLPGEGPAVISSAAMGACGRVAQPASQRSWAVRQARVIIFGVSGWGDASGHASLFNGSSCYDKCYFNSPGAKYQTRDAVLWVLPWAGQ